MSLKDFKFFLETKEETSKDLDSQVLSHIQSQSKKDEFFLFGKSLLIHLGAGLLTLLLCPQFGWNPFSSSFDIAHLLMPYGQWVCALFCSFIFISSGSLLKFFILRKYELKRYSKLYLKSSLALSVIFVIPLMLIGKSYAQDVMEYTLSFTLFWFLGALISDSLISFLGFTIKGHKRD